MFPEGYKFNKIVGFRSAISVYHEPIDRFTVGQHLRVSTRLSGIFNNRTTQPKFNFVCDVKNVLDLLETINSDGCSLKEFNLHPFLPSALRFSDVFRGKKKGALGKNGLKLNMLLALTSGARASEISFLDIQYLVKHTISYIFQFG